jgi:phospholipid transport system substrate-binding protein
MNTLDFFVRVPFSETPVMASLTDARPSIAPRRPSLRMKAIALAIAVFATIGLPGLSGLSLPGFTVATAHADNDPKTITQTMVNRALQIMGNKSTPIAQRRHQLVEVVENDFDFTEMSRSALGYHWRSLLPEQRTQFTQLFTAFIEDAYLSKIQDYAGQKVEFLGQTSLGQGYTQINTSIVQAGKSTILVNYLLLQKAGTWKIYDVTVDAISIVANYRNQFNRVINDKGFDVLMADLKAKQQELSSLLGN